MTLILRAAARSDVGLVRSNNEDAVHVGDRLLVLADGMGGLPAGELASAILVREFVALDTLSADADPLAALRTTLAAANDRIRAEAVGDASRAGMGTTVTALLLAGDRLALLNVGDSRCYLLRAGALTQLTRDDTYVQALVDSGVLTAADARRHPQRALVTQAVQGGQVTPTATLVDPLPGDRLLLCSDGLSDYVDDDVIAAVLRAGTDPEQTCAELVKEALRVGAPDNVTVVVADLVRPDGAGQR